MAQYKVLQDIEAEDKLVGPLTLRQFIYAGITAVCLYLCFICITQHLLFALPIFLLPGALTGFFAFPWGRDQPTEIWALAKIRFLFKPRKRVWNQSGVKKLVTVTAPRKVEISYTDGLSQREVKSRLRALADTIDTRGWAIKNVTAGIYQPVMAGSRDSDRLIDITNLPAVVPTITDHTSDVLDENTSPMAQSIETKMRESDAAHKQRVSDSMEHTESHRSIRPRHTAAENNLRIQNKKHGHALAVPQDNAQPDNLWFMSQPQPAPTQAQATIPDQPVQDNRTPEPSTSLEPNTSPQTLEDIYAQVPETRQHTIQPLSDQQAIAEQAAREAQIARANTAQSPVTQTTDPAIIALANNDDFNVATLARQAKKQSGQSPDEVVISLH